MPTRGAVEHVVIDATGLKVYGEGEWKTRKQDKNKWRIWRKLHLAVDVSTHEVIAEEISLVSVGDNEVLATLLNSLRRKTQQVSADGANDTRACHPVLKKKRITPSIPPRSNAGYWEEGHPRNEAVKVLKEDKQAEWKKDRAYHKQLLAETAMFRYKQLLRTKLILRYYNAQVSKWLANMKAMNKIIRLAMFVRQQTN
ncbi:Mobile element protein [Candidatus Enterovibrio escicola]|uniref:Mobile element protein n=1 Tax=Candidatus Enterovibrio escicola TaxID=1927127 RepID=A0A2A5T657_9GAMM|nr:Mobile element protein [Candidatus Enterovibrio escacola]